MKKLLAFAALFAVVALTSCKYDDDDRTIPPESENACTFM